MTKAEWERELESLIEKSQGEFKGKLEALLRAQGGLTRDQYVSYLSMQYHLTKHVQKYFFLIAAHPAVMKRPNLRKFALKFGVDEAPHYRIASKDLTALGEPLREKTFAVELWHVYFSSVVEKSPFLRLGAACFLENIAGASGSVIDALFRGSTFLTPACMRFFLIHKHESQSLDHGNMILNVIRESGLTEKEGRDLVEGARKAKLLYGLMVDESLE